MFSIPIRRLALPIIVSFALAATISSSALADRTNNAASDPALERAAKREGLECRRVRETGSRTSKKVCTTKAQRDKRAQRARDDLERVQRTADLSPSAN